MEAALRETTGTETETERVAFAAIEEAFLGVLKKKIGLWNEADGVLQQLEVDLAREKANHDNNII